MVAQFCKYTKAHWIVLIERVNVTVFELYLYKIEIYTNTYTQVCWTGYLHNPLLISPSWKVGMWVSGVQNNNYTIGRAELKCVDFLCGHNELLIWTKQIDPRSHKESCFGDTSLRDALWESRSESILSTDWLKKIKPWSVQGKQTWFLLSNTPIT